VSIKYIRRASGRVDAFEIRINTDGGHQRQNFGEGAPAGTSERRREDSTMFGLRAAAVRPGTLLESPNEFFVDPANEQVRHVFGAPIVPC
jgi:hypothetical protein